MEETHRRGGNRNCAGNAIQLTNQKNFEGSIPEIGCILALKFENLDNKAQFQVFMDKISNYTYSNIKNRGDL